MAAHSLIITTNLGSLTSEKRFPSSITIRELKASELVRRKTGTLPPLLIAQGKLELITGATASYMQLQLFDKQSKFVCDLDNDDTVLGAYPVQDGFRIHVWSP